MSKLNTSDIDIEFNPEELDFEKGDGLVPAIIQDHQSLQVLMLGYMNRESLDKTLKEGKVTFYSRSKQRLWTKGETSGNFLHVREIQKDCDADTLLIRVKPEGPACHTGHTSCFFDKEFQPADQDFAFLQKLEALLRDRKTSQPEGSYTASLFQKGIDRIAQKVGEEGIETVIAAKNTEDDEELIYESSDLLFHLMVLLVERDIPLTALVKELESRHGN